MRGCRHLSNSSPEIDGLNDLLPEPEQHLHDVAIAREHRQSQQGYATPADARAFLQMARTGPSTVNPIVRAYFRAADETAEPDEAPASPASPSPALRAADVHGDTTDAPESIAAVIALLTEAGMMPEHPRALLEAGDADTPAAEPTHVRRLMEYLAHADDTAFLTRSRELAFLANVLLAGCSVQSRPFTPQEASDAATSICNLGLEYWPARWPGVTAPGASSPPDSFLIDHDLVTAFEVGWSVLYRDVSVFVARQLISTLADLHCVDRDIRRDLVALRRALKAQLDAGTPWRARQAADVLATLDATSWAAVLGLLDECPIMPAALTAILEHRTTTVSPTAFGFISTAAQIADVRRFMTKLPDLLSG